MPIAATDLIGSVLNSRKAAGFSIQAYGCEGYTAEQPLKYHTPSAERCAALKASLLARGWTVEAL